MADSIQTSTPLVFNKFIPPPPRRLWSADSPMEQLYRNKWMQYRNSMSEKDPWNALDSPHFIDFKELPDVEDNYFDEAEEEKISTPTSFQAQQRLPGFDFENNNILDDLKKCTLSAIKPKNEYNRGQATNDFNRLEETIRRISQISDGFGKIISSTIEEDDVKQKIEKGVDREQGDLKKNVEKQLAAESKTAKKTCTIVEPFSFETREKFRQEHTQARRERDSFGRELRKGFRATPLPKFVKVREKVPMKANMCLKSKEANNKNNNIKKMANAAEIWKKKAFQPMLAKRAPIVPKAPNLMTAARAKERQRFEEEIRKKDLERLELRKKEEAARKKREEEEIAKLRRELVHKAQPIRKYKIVVPKVTKRELADPTIPLQCKRPRKF